MRHLYRFILLFFLGIILVNCTTTVLTSQQASTQTPLTIWWNETYYPEESEVIQNLLTQWEKKSGIKATLTFYNEDNIIKQTLDAVETGNPPDILFSNTLDRQVIPRLAWEDKLTDVSDVVLPIKDLLMPGVLEAVHYQNRVTKTRGYYAVPIGQDTAHLHYWRDLLAEAGFKDEDIPSEWDAFWNFWKTAQDRLRQAGKKEIYGMGMPMSPNTTDTTHQFEEFLAAYNVKLLDPEGNLQLNKPEVRQGIIKALNQFTSFYREGYVPLDAVNWGNADNNISFLSRGTIMVANTTLSIPASQRQDEKVYQHKMVTIEYPKKPDGTRLSYLVSVKQAVVFKASKNTNNAKEFLKYFVQPEHLSAYIEGAQGRYFPVMIQSLNAPFWSNSNDPHISVAVRQFRQSNQPFLYAINPAYIDVELKKVWGNAIQRICVEKVSPEQAADEAIEKIKTIFAQWK